MSFIKIAAYFRQVWRKISQRTHMVGVQLLAEHVNLIREVLVLRDDPHTKGEPRFLGWEVKEPGLNAAMLLGGDNTATWIFWRDGGISAKSSGGKPPVAAMLQIIEPISIFTRVLLCYGSAHTRNPVT